MPMCLFIFEQTRAQSGQNNLWLGGFEDQSPPPWGGVDLNFSIGELIITTAERTIDFKRTNANITDESGYLLFSTNGAYVANAFGDTMFNGTGLNPSWYTSQFLEGLHLSQACMILPKPASQNIFYLIHGTIDEPTGPYAQYLYLTTIDMSLGDGIGAVVSKNEILIDDQLNTGRITAVRHANGRDWWVFCHKVDSNSFYRLLVTPEGVAVDGLQSIGIVRAPDNGQACISPDGNKLAYYWAFDLEIFDLDRCTGLFSNATHINISDPEAMGGVAFSPNSRFLYLTSVLNVHQFDMEASDVPSSMIHIAEWDGFYSPSPPFATMFDIAQIAPDGKIYIGTGNSTSHLHVIHDPDQSGLACNIQQHGIELPRYFMNSLPNHPNYHLGPIDGSICDSLGINVSVPNQDLQIYVTAYPNPSNASFTLSYPSRSIEGSVEVVDATGRIIYRKRLPQWTTIHQFDLLGQAPGMYHCRLSWGGQNATTRVIIQHE